MNATARAGLAVAALAAPAVVSLALLAAHFYRGGETALAAGVAAMGSLFAVRRRWARRALQAVLALAAVEWLRTLAALAATRLSMGLPHARLAFILGAVAALAAAAAWLLESARLRRAFDGAVRRGGA